jgi:glyoxylase-like metal-dependent hydrolase (beta-lactamase superfamily II)
MASVGRVHHLDCGTMCPFGLRWFGGGRDALVCHCLLVETSDGLVLVDTGFGLADIDDPNRLGPSFERVARPVRDRSQCAVAQVERLGFSAADVRHIVPTHLDLDHVGGLADFPHAKVHVYEPELEAALARATAQEKERYRPVQWAHGPQWIRYREQGEAWFGFDAVRQLEGLPPEILLIPTVGHSRGHVAVAVDDGRGKPLLHAGDAYFHASEMAADRPHCPPGLALFQRMVATDDRSRRRNQERLRLLAREHGVRLFCAHDSAELERLRAASVTKGEAMAT